MGRPAGGVKGIELVDDDAVVSMIVVPDTQDLSTCMLLTGCLNGFGKRTPVEDYRLIRRGGKGVINIKTTDRNGEVVGMQAVCDDNELMLISEKGILIRIRVADIRETGRNAAGVKLINLDEGDKLVAMAKIDADETEKGPGAPSNPVPPVGNGGSPPTTPA
jgi:DNA gyrase subunit A